MSEIIRLKLKSYDNVLLQTSLQRILEVIKEIKVPFRGPILLPTKEEKITIKKSTHVYKEINETYSLRTHVRMIDIYSKSPKIIDALSKITLYSGVDISIKF